MLNHHRDRIFDIQIDGGVVPQIDNSINIDEITNVIEQRDKLNQETNALEKSIKSLVCGVYDWKCTLLKLVLNGMNQVV